MVSSPTEAMVPSRAMHRRQWRAGGAGEVVLERLKEETDGRMMMEGRTGAAAWAAANVCGKVLVQMLEKQEHHHRRRSIL